MSMTSKKFKVGVLMALAPFLYLAGWLTVAIAGGYLPNEVPIIEAFAMSLWYALAAWFIATGEI